LLDIMRDPTRDDARPHERRAAIDLVTGIEAGDLHCLVAEQVELEFREHDAQIQAEAEDAIRRLVERVDRTNAVHGVFATATSVRLDHLTAQVAAARAVVERWLQSAQLAPGSDDVNSRAISRVNGNVSPARRGKDSVKDCIVLETYLAAVRALRSHGMSSKVVLLSSNTREYLSESKVLKMDLVPDFSALAIDYAPNMAAAKAMLGF
jgi:hypothetical protein